MKSEPNTMKTDKELNKKLLIVDLAQTSLIFIGVAGFYFFAKPPVEEVIYEMVMGEEVSSFWNEVLVGVGVLLSLVVLGLLAYFILSWLFAKPIFEGKIKIRHLLDLSEEERWSYIEAKDKGDLEEQMKILRGCGCGCGCKDGDANNCTKCSDCTDDSCKCQKVKNEIEGVKTETE